MDRLETLRTGQLRQISERAATTVRIRVRPSSVDAVNQLAADAAWLLAEVERLTAERDELAEEVHIYRDSEDANLWIAHVERDQWRACAEQLAAELHSLHYAFQEADSWLYEHYGNTRFDDETGTASSSALRVFDALNAEESPTT